MGAVVIEVTDNIACHLFIIWVFDLELVIQAMRGCKEVRFSVVSRVVDKRSRATGRPVDNHQDYAAFDSVVTGCRILVAGDDRHTFESRKVGLRFRESEVSIAVVHLADREFSRESGFAGSWYSMINSSPWIGATGRMPRSELFRWLNEPKTSD